MGGSDASKVTSSTGNDYVDVDALNARMQRLKGLKSGRSDASHPRKALRVLQNPSLASDGLESAIEIPAAPNASDYFGWSNVVDVTLASVDVP